MGSVPGGQASAPGSNLIGAYHQRGHVPGRQASAPGHLRGIKAQWERPPQPSCPAPEPRAIDNTFQDAADAADQRDAAAPGQAQVPIQADFDASQVRTDMPGLAASV